MSTVAEELAISTSDGTMTGYAFMPEGDGPHPAVIVIQEIFGVDDHIKDVARRFAAEGYYAVAPDLFYRQGAGLTVSYENREEAFALRATTTPEGITADLNALMAHLGSDARANSNVGIVGYCFGGGVVYLASHAVPGISAAAIYYGGGIVPPRRRTRGHAQRPGQRRRGRMPGHRLLGRGGRGHPRRPRRAHRAGAEGRRQGRGVPRLQGRRPRLLL